MGVFRTLIKSYRKVKDAKNECCENLLSSLHELVEEAKLNRLEMEMEKDDYQDYKKLFLEGKISATFKTTEMLMNGQITTKEYEIFKKFEKLLIQKLIDDVDSGKITHREFFNELNK